MPERMSYDDQKAVLERAAEEYNRNASTPIDFKIRRGWRGAELVVELTHISLSRREDAIRVAAAADAQHKAIVAWKKQAP